MGEECWVIGVDARARALEHTRAGWFVACTPALQHETKEEEGKEKEGRR